MKSGLDLTYLQASGKETSQLMNGSMQYRPRFVLAIYPLVTAKIFHRDIFWFFLKDEEFDSKTINDSNTDLNKFPASKVTQHEKKMESSKKSTRHTKQVASDPQVAQINLMRHQCTDLPASKHKKRKPFVKPRPPSHKKWNKWQAKPLQEQLWCQESLQEQGEMWEVWRFKSHWRFPMSSQEVLM